MAELDSNRSGPQPENGSPSQPESSIAPQPERSITPQPEGGSVSRPECCSAPQAESSGDHRPHSISPPESQNNCAPDATSKNKDCVISIEDDLKPYQSDIPNVRSAQLKSGEGLASSSSSDSSSKDNWVTVIKEGLRLQAQKKTAKRKPKKLMFRASRLMREAKPEHYNAEDFSFGLYDRPLLDAQRNIGDKCKLAIASAVLKFLGLDWEQLCRKVVREPLRMQRLYEDFGRDSLSEEEVRSVLTLDAVFLASLGTQFPRFAWRFWELESDIYMRLPNAIPETLWMDLFKLENQIPLSLIRTVLHTLVEKQAADLDDTDKGNLVERTLTVICGKSICHQYFSLPGAKLPYDLPTKGMSYKGCHNLLECMYRVLCKGVKEEPNKEDNTEQLSFLSFLGCPKREGKKEPEDQKEKPTEDEEDEDNKEDEGEEDDDDKEPLDEEDDEGWQEDVIQGLPTAAELHKAGVEFKGRTGQSLNVDFQAGWLKAIIYLPTIDISYHTEALWRNLLAYEENLPNEDFCCYLSFMDALIDTPEDVMLLKSGRQPVIIGKPLGSNEEVACLFNRTIIKGSSAPSTSEKWRSTVKKISSFHNQGRRKMYWEFVLTYFGKPWLTTSVVAATLLLIMTFLQTYYTVDGYYKR